jgi:hypothetical protein
MARDADFYHNLPDGEVFIEGYNDPKPTTDLEAVDARLMALREGRLQMQPRPERSAQQRSSRANIHESVITVLERVKP